MLHIRSSNESPTDEHLAVRAAAGCSQSFETLVRRFQTRVLHFLTRRTRSREDAEDLTQEAFVRAYENLGRYNVRWRFSTWIFTIAQRLAASHVRRRRPTDQSIELSDTTDAAAQPAQRLAAIESRQRLWDIAAEALDETKFTAMWLHYVEEMTAAEVGHVLGRSRVAVKTMLHRARKQLKPALADDSEDFLPAAFSFAGSSKAVLAEDVGA